MLSLIFIRDNKINKNNNLNVFKVLSKITISIKKSLPCKSVKYTNINNNNNLNVFKVLDKITISIKKSCQCKTDKIYKY